jgi:hypothetical protein
MASRHPLLGPSLTITCGGCPVRGHGCADCMVTALLSLAPPAPPVLAGVADADADAVDLDRDEARAVDLLLRAGLVSAQTAATAHARRVTPGQRAVG